MNLINEKFNTIAMPDDNGFFGTWGGSFVPRELEKALSTIREEYIKVSNNPDFVSQLMFLNEHFTGRPSPVYHAQRLSKAVGGAQIYLKREDLNHTGSHKINHAIGEALLAKHLNKKKIIAETGAGQHGVALATAAALLGLDCDIYMGEVDIKKEAPNVSRMKILGAKVISVTEGTKTLKDAVDAAFRAYLKDPENLMYCIGTVVGPAPFPEMVRDFQSIIGLEAKEQMKKLIGKNPDNVVACVGGGSNAMGIFSAFIDDKKTKLFGVEPAGKGLNTPYHAASLTKGRPGIIHGFRCYVLQDNEGTTLPVYSIASGLDYPGVGPQHCYLKDIERVKYETITDREAVEAFYGLSRMEGIIPALESSHALAYAIKLAGKLEKEETILVSLSGRGDKDIDFVMENYPIEEYRPDKKAANEYKEFLSHIKNKKLD